MSAPESDPPEPATQLAVPEPATQLAGKPTASQVAKPTPAITAIAARAPSLDFLDHATFHSTVARAVAGGGVAALAADLGATALGFADSPEAFTVAVTAGAFAAIATTGRRWFRTLAGGVIGLAGGTAYLLAARYPLFGALLLGGAAAPVLAAGEPPKRMAVTGAVAGAFGLAGIYVGNWMENIGLLGGLLPGPLATAVAGSAVGLFFGLSAAPRHVGRTEDPVELAYDRALALEDGEVHEILARAVSIHRSVRSDIAEKKGVATLERLGVRVGELAMRILRIAEQCRQISRDLSSAPAEELEGRIRTLTSKAGAATDPAARETYLGAIDTLEGQKKNLDELNRGRERVIARLHAHLVLLEKVRFSLLHLKSADAERLGGESSPILDAIDELSRELDVTSSAVGEVFGRQSVLGDRSLGPGRS